MLFYTFTYSKNQTNTRAFGKLDSLENKHKWCIKEIHFNQNIWWFCKDEKTLNLTLKLCNLLINSNINYKFLLYK